MTIQRSVVGTEAACDEVVVLANKALGFPAKGRHVGGGRHVDMPDTWDGTGPTPPGWTKTVTAVYVSSPTDAAVPVSDTLAAALQDAKAQAKLTGQERAALATALAGRTSVELDGRTRKEAVLAAKDSRATDADATLTLK